MKKEKILELRNEFLGFCSKFRLWRSNCYNGHNYFDKRIIKRVSFSSSFEKTTCWKKYKYSKEGYSHQIIGDIKDKTFNILFANTEK
jgi:lysozyme family protein